MANTTFTGPVISTNGFVGAVTGDVTGDVTGAVAATTLTPTGTETLNGTAIIVSDLPTSDPSVAGQIYSDSNVLTVSAG